MLIIDRRNGQFVLICVWNVLQQDFETITILCRTNLPLIQTSVHPIVTSLIQDKTLGGAGNHFHIKSHTPRINCALTHQVFYLFTPIYYKELMPKYNFSRH